MSDRKSLGYIAAFVIIVCVGWAIIGAFFGHVDSYFGKSRCLFPEGMIIGAIGGLLAALVWCRAVISRAITAARSGLTFAGSAIRRGFYWGMLVGAVSAVAVHTCIWGILGRLEVKVIGVILMFGLAIGFAVGMTTGFVCALAVALTARAERRRNGPQHESRV